MDYQVNWSPEALDDIDDIAAYIQKDSPLYAQAVVEQLIESSRKLQDHPYRGRVVPEINDQRYREIFIYNFRLIYRVVGSSVDVLAVIHAARQLEAINDRFETIG